MTTFAIPEIETPRLRLRGPRAADLPAYAAFREGPRSVTVGGPFAPGTSLDALATVAGHWPLRGWGRWIVADRETDAALGLVGGFFPPDWPERELGWTVFDGHEGRGIAFEAATAARRYLYETLGWDRLISAVAPGNARSVALARRLGARHEGHFEHPQLGRLDVWRHPSPKELT